MSSPNERTPLASSPGLSSTSTLNIHAQSGSNNNNNNSSSNSAPTTSNAPGGKRNMFWTLGCLYGASAVCFGAFGAHGLKKVVTDPARLASFSTAAHYQLLHSVALLVASQAAPDNRAAGGLLTAGMTLFSGSIYALVLDPARFRFLGPVTPIGGLCLIGGWVALAFK